MTSILFKQKKSLAVLNLLEKFSVPLHIILLSNSQPNGVTQQNHI